MVAQASPNDVAAGVLVYDAAALRFPPPAPPRNAVEDSLAPLRRIKLHRRIVDVSSHADRPGTPVHFSLRTVTV